ncbi:MAG TPA: ATP-binding cassette domain-containing protein [Anaerolineae bacterium]|nr:ATP-binding cassette domain-containing protein [Anaerolineae bacterium]
MSIVVDVNNLGKRFQLKQKGEGLWGSVRSLWRPDVREVTAVQGISFALEEGEMLAFIGPNGAGKSTTIKMLTGILFPSEGEAEVLGLTPWRQRRQLAYQIGSVFGQKPQLWYHLPAADTFRLFARIYELDERAYQQRLGFLVDTFQLEPLLHIPVRKLSLGQRMKCEIAASLLHRPRIIFLDEPTIGLDVVAKHQIREAIKFMNETDRTTIFLTSHDAGDIEKLCRRVIIINYGQLIFDDRTTVLKRDYWRQKQIDVRFAEPLATPFALSGVTILKQGDYGVKLAFDTQEIAVETVVQQLMARGACEDINISDPPLEEIISDIYTAAQG